MGSNDVRGALQRRVNDAKASYELTFQPSPPNAGEAYHRIEVRVAEPHLQARTTQGYYTQPWRRHPWCSPCPSELQVSTAQTMNCLLPPFRASSCEARSASV